MDEYNTPETCIRCGAKTEKMYTKFLFSGSKPQHAEWNPAFGKVIKNKDHRKEEAKKRDWVEVGNEPLASLEKNLTKTKEDNYKNSWESV